MRMPPALAVLPMVNAAEAPLDVACRLVKVAVWLKLALVGAIEIALPVLMTKLLVVEST